MKVEVSLTPALYPYRTLKENPVTVAIDVLRATTAVCAAFQAGCREVVPLDSLEALEPYRQKGYAIAAERGGKKLPGSDYGNSPTEYMSKEMSGVRLAYSTTNGTVSILKGADADLTLVGAFANLDALCERLAAERRDTVLLCSGWQNDFCIEDTLVAGAIIERLVSGDDIRPRQPQAAATPSNLEGEPVSFVCGSNSSPKLGEQQNGEASSTSSSANLEGEPVSSVCGSRSSPKLGEVDARSADGGVCVCGDAAHMALDLWQLAKENPFAFCQKASHVHRLQGFGPQAQADIEFAFRLNTCPVVPVLEKGILRIEN